MAFVKPKKSFGQHFLKNENIASDIANCINTDLCKNVLEIGPGMGILTKYLQPKPINLKVIELDSESVLFLKSYKIIDPEYIIEGDFLRLDLTTVFNNQEFTISGNFPYNISSQIVFKAIENRALVPQLSGMFQREVARRIASGPGSKEYGIISVLTQAFYNAKYEFTVLEHEFNPPPKVKSGVITLTRKENLTINCDEKMFFIVVKTAFNQRRKTLQNSLKSLLNSNKLNDSIAGLRPEQLHVEQFIELTNFISAIKEGGKNGI